MIKILSAAQIREADAYTIQHEPVSSINLMERAAEKCTEWILQNIEPGIHFNIFCGTGNNGGDGLAIARMLVHNGKQVNVYVISSSKESVDFTTNKQKLIDDGNTLIELKEKSDLPVINRDEIIIDAIFGSGLNKEITGVAADCIEMITRSEAMVISIDMPSGLRADESLFNIKSPVVQADVTLTFQLPKLSFMYPMTGKYVEDFVLLDIGLHPDYINKAKTNFYFITKNDVAQLIKPGKKFDHKGTYGHALIIAGSYGKMGAAILASKSCLRTGAGLVTVHAPKCGVDILQTAFAEAMVVVDEEELFITQIQNADKYNAIGIGPGIGTDEKTAVMLKKLIQDYRAPIVFDADAINILAENKTWLSFLAPGCIFTPHPKEFERLVGKSTDDFERQQMQFEFSKKYQCYVLLKGHYSALTTPDGNCYFNSTGNAGMATAGAGDVLTGIITSLVAQGYSSKHACIIGMYLHGLAGDNAAKEKGEHSLIASDVIEHLSDAYLALIRSDEI